MDMLVFLGALICLALAAVVGWSVGRASPPPVALGIAAASGFAAVSSWMRYRGTVWANGSSSFSVQFDHFFQRLGLITIGTLTATLTVFLLIGFLHRLITRK